MKSNSQGLGTFLGAYKILAVILAAAVVLGAAGVALFISRQPSQAQTTTPTIHFAQLPWAPGHKWNFATGPHNFAAKSATVYDGLDFDAPSSEPDKSIRAVSDGTITAVKANASGALCSSPKCANDTNSVIERVQSGGASYLVGYYHLQRAPA